MENLDEALGKLLSDPNAMAQVMSLAQSLGAMIPQEAPAQAQEAAFPIQGLEKLLQSAGGTGRHTALFQALGPYLSPKRQKKLERAIQIGRLSGLASLALQQTDREE